MDRDWILQRLRKTLRLNAVLNHRNTKVKDSATIDLVIKSIKVRNVGRDRSRPYVSQQVCRDGIHAVRDNLRDK